mgnify:CR=1 FL=1
MHINDHIPFRRPFHYHHVCWTTKRRCKKWHFDNVERTKTTNKKHLDSSYIGFFVILRLIVTPVIFDLVRAKKQHMTWSWVCLKSSLFATFDEKDDLSNCDIGRANTQSIISLVQGSLIIQIKTTFSMREMLTLEYFVPLYVYFVRRSTLNISENSAADKNRTQRTCSRPQNHYQLTTQGFVGNTSMILTHWNGCWPWICGQ